ncbi:HlyD family secretion protein [Nitrospirillum iridis]|uniref:Membrane fusion protein (Multidrug efflux system) n=1 Tax=Nitrospirillum iridis TaxID=765888 RepID=A0A7X0EHW7_9PROT|nr:HlyD family secretion protein [Nitrospirillum iridis]MBB6255119.1 membrane fusion protein (multidrug efflux system) [Nitrospirillum iridis]
MANITDTGAVPALSGAQAGGGRLKRILLAGAGVAALAFAAHAGMDYWRTGRFLVETDDAYVDADASTIAPHVSGYIAQVLVDDNQVVKAGQPLAVIDDRDLATALAQARAARQTAEAKVANIVSQITLQQALIDQAAARLVSARAAAAFASQDSDRFNQLVATGAGSAQKAQQATSVHRQAEADVTTAEASVVAARQQVDVLKTQRAAAEMEVEQAEAVEHQAELNLGYATITAPVDGVVGARSVRVGRYVQAGTQLMAVVPLRQVYVVANLKETQLTDVKPGQPVDIAVDTYPGVVVHGRVDSISPASGLKFALLPADNATGNFTKIVQRVPVKIRLDADAAAGKGAVQLRPGMSVEPSINTKDAAN